MRNQNENVITGKLVNLLNGMSANWELEEQQRPFRNSQKIPDIFMSKKGHEPVAIEAKYADTHTEEELRKQATAHIGRELKTEHSKVTPDAAHRHGNPLPRVVKGRNRQGH